MSAWAALELFKATVSYALSPAYYASDLFWTTLGYGSNSRQLLTSVSRAKSIASPCGSGLPPAQPGVRFFTGDVTAAFADLPPHSQAPTARQPHRPSTEEAPSPSIPHPPSPPSSPSADSLLASSDEASAVLLPDAPLSTLLHHFSQRATQCLSSFELLEDCDLSGALTQTGRPTYAEVLVREPTAREEAWVRRSMVVELAEVERVVRAAVEHRGEAVEAQAPKTGTYFDTMEMSYADVAVDSHGGVDALQFIKAIESTVAMLELFAPAAAPLIAPGIHLDLGHLRSRAIALASPSPSLQSIVLAERALPKKRRLATEALEWQARGLRFLALALRASLRLPGEELSQSFTRAWDTYYARYFSWVVRPLFKLLIKACPSREGVWARLGEDRAEAEVACARWLDGIEDRLDRVDAFFEGGKFSVL